MSAAESIRHDLGTVALRPLGGNRKNVMNVAFPTNLSEALAERGYNRARLFLTDEGLLLVPYHDLANTARNRQPVSLPDWPEP